MTSIPWSPGRLVDLHEDECWEFLQSQQVGRLAWIVGGHPQIVPLNFTVEADAVWVRTSAYSQLGREAPGTPVAFEADDVDPFNRSGTSVVVLGVAETVDDVPRRWSGPEPWADGVRALVLRIVPDEISGRRVLPA